MELCSTLLSEGLVRCLPGFFTEKGCTLLISVKTFAFEGLEQWLVNEMSTQTNNFLGEYNVETKVTLELNFSKLKSHCVKFS